MTSPDTPKTVETVLETFFKRSSELIAQLQLKSIDNEMFEIGMEAANDVAVKAINSIRRADMEYVIGQDDDRPFAEHVIQNGLRADQRSRMEERLKS